MRFRARSIQIDRLLRKRECAIEDGLLSLFGCVLSSPRQVVPVRESLERARIAWIDFQRAFVKRLRFRDRSEVIGPVARQRVGSQDMFIGDKIVRLLAQYAIEFGLRDMSNQCCHDALRDLVLNHKEI